jgi:hypothetical protein
MCYCPSFEDAGQSPALDVGVPETEPRGIVFRIRGSVSSAVPGRSCYSSPLSGIGESRIGVGNFLTNGDPASAASVRLRPEVSSCYVGVGTLRNVYPTPGTV